MTKTYDEIYELILLSDYEVIMTKTYDEIHEVILLKIHSVQETFSEHENLA